MDSFSIEPLFVSIVSNVLALERIIQLERSDSLLISLTAKLLR